ncbi:BQ2448_1727 [Microbotryum intermedium]|uniref:ubiquitinyl hydrolase 1 n=1 Tax=Microbotryum intermedium TaxID=269621 RepID=A0A238FE91_9BASI|nr:BQ2448_1727 [Microbotryum intermedium]
MRSDRGRDSDSDPDAAAAAHRPRTPFPLALALSSSSLASSSLTSTSISTSASTSSSCPIVVATTPAVAALTAAAAPPSPTLSARKRALSDASQSSESSAHKRHLSVDPTGTADSPSDIDSLGASRLDLEGPSERGEDDDDEEEDDNDSHSHNHSQSGDVAMDDDSAFAASLVRPTTRSFAAAAAASAAVQDDEHLPSYTSSTLASTAVTPSATMDDDEDDDGSVPVTLERTESPPDGPNQLALIQDWLSDAQNEMAQGDSWYLVSRTWYRRWQTACSGVRDDKNDDDDVDELSIENLGPVNNADILDQSGALKRPVEEGRDVVLLSPQAWDFLVKWYGRSSLPIKRQVVSTGGIGSERVEFYPPTFAPVKVLPSESLATNVSIPIAESTPTLSLSSGSTVRELKELCAIQYGLSSGRESRLWRLPTDEEVGLAAPLLDGPGHIFAEKLSRVAQAGHSVELIERGEVSGATSLNDAMLTDEMTRLAIEQQNEDGKWLVDETSILASSSASLQSSVDDKKKPMFGTQFFDRFAVNQLVPRHKNGVERAATSNHSNLASSGSGGGLLASFGGALTRSKSNTRSGQRGLTGLTNLGNTCFMNSALQCMSNTKELQEYFSSGVYKSEINRTNPLGMRGQVAESFGQLIERLWSTSSGAYAPRDFKQALSRFAPQFSGYGQQDTQELLAFLLDGVHEDLNRIKKKPPTSAPDWEGGSDKEMFKLAKTCWEQYRSRNDSVIVDLFQGQYRSTVVCPDCDKVSITFDPFMYVTMNLPVSKKWEGRIYFVPLDPKRARYAVDLEVPKNGTIKTAKAMVAKLVDCDPKHLVTMEEWKGKPFKAWYDDDMISELNTERDCLVFWETSGPFPQPKPREYGRTKPLPMDPDAPIVIPVMHKARSKLSGSSHRSYGASNHGDAFGSPFLLTLTREQASSVEGIELALATQYARVTKRGKELLEFVELEQDTGAAASPHVPTAAMAGPSLNLPPTPPPEASMEVDAAVEDDASPSTSAGLTSTAASSVSSTSKAPRSKGPFQLYVSKHPVTKYGLPLGQRDCEGTPVVPLESRLPRAPSPETDMFKTSSSPAPGHVPGAFPTTEEESSSVMSTDESTSAPVELELPSDAVELVTHSTTPKAATKPLVKNGDFFHVEWEPAALAHYFGGNGSDGEQATWAQVESLVDPVLAERRNRPRGAAKKAITIQDCLNEFTKEERLGEDDTWYCPVCKKHQQATKKVELWKVPDVLVFAFKRFSANRYSRDKLDDLVDFPLEGFDIEPYVEGVKVERRLAGETGAEEPESLIYDLYAVDNHYGGMGGGHYTAYAKNHENGKWYDFDDSRVSEISNPEAVKTKAAYLCFYRRRTTRPIGAKSRELIDSAIQSRNASAANSDAGLPSGPNSLDNSPSGSTDNLGANAHSTSALHSPYTSIRQSTTIDDDEEDDLYGDTTLSTTLRARPNFFKGTLAPAMQDSSSSSSDSDLAEPGSPRGFAATNEDDWNPLNGNGDPLTGQIVDDQVVEVKLNDEEEGRVV